MTHTNNTDRVIQSLVDFAKANDLHSIDLTIRPDGRVTIRFEYPFRTVPPSQQMRTIHADLDESSTLMPPAFLLEQAGVTLP